MKYPRESVTDEHFDLAKTWLEFDPNTHLSQDRFIQQEVPTKRVSTTNDVQPEYKKHQVILRRVEHRSAKARTATVTTDPTTVKSLLGNQSNLTGDLSPDVKDTSQAPITNGILTSKGDTSDKPMVLACKGDATRHKMPAMINLETSGLH